MTTATKEKPILFSGAMVKAILDNRKTMTRRVVKNFYEAANPQRWVIRANADTRVTYANRDEALAAMVANCPYGQPGDVLWMRSNFNVRYDEQRDEAHWTSEGLWVTTHGKPMRNDGTPLRCGFKPSMHMPYWLSVERWPRLELTEVRIERLNEITEADAIAEGFFRLPASGRYALAQGGQYFGNAWASARNGFVELWDSLNADRGYSWESDPWVWALSFRRLP